MSAWTKTTHGVAVRWRVMPALLIVAVAGLGVMAPAHAVAGSGIMTGSPAPREGTASTFTAYVVNGGSGTVTPISTATNTAGTPIQAGSFASTIAITPDGKTAYVGTGTSESDTVTPIATATNTAGPAITVGDSEEEALYAIVITPDGRTAYAVLTGGTVPITTATNTAGESINGSGVYPDAFAMTPDGKTLYVAGANDYTVTPISTATSTASRPIFFDYAPVAIAITPDSKTAYVAVAGERNVFPVATATNTAGPPIPVDESRPESPVAIAITPDGETAYVVSANYNSGSVTPITTATNTAGTPIPVGSYPIAIAVTPDGKTAYILNQGSDTVTPISTATNTAEAPIPVGNTPVAISITPDGKTAYVVNYGSDTVTPISTATNTAGPAIPVGSDPVAIAITPTAASQGPAFTSSPAATAAFGSAFTFTVTTTGDPAPRITRTGRLPAGVRFADNPNGTATISGIPRKAAAGVYPLTLTGRNKNGTVTQAFTLTVTRAPALRKIRAIRARAGNPLHQTLRATGYPAPALTESGPLPRGLSFADNGNGTAVIAGTPDAGSCGRYPVAITATNSSGTTTRHFTIDVSQRRRR